MIESLTRIIAVLLPTAPQASIISNFSVTTPQAHLFGSGETRYEDLLTGVDTTGDGTPDDGFAADRQEGLDATSRSPWAVGLGAAWRGDRFVLHFSTEWYSKVSKYTVLESAPISNTEGDSLGPLRVVAELEPVLNAAVGVEWHFGETFSAFGGAATDGSAAADTPTPTGGSVFDTQVFVGDAFHVGGGVSASTPWFSVTTGLQFVRSDEGLPAPFAVQTLARTDVFVPVTTMTIRWLIGLSILLGSEPVQPSG